MVRIELRTKRASEKRGAEDETDKSNSKSETMDANRGKLGVVFLAAVLCFGVQSRREKQTVVLETQNSFSKEVVIRRKAPNVQQNGQTAGQWMGIMKQQRTLRLRGNQKKIPKRRNRESYISTVCGEVAAPGRL